MQASWFFFQALQTATGDLDSQLDQLLEEASYDPRDLRFPETPRVSRLLAFLFLIASLLLLVRHLLLEAMHLLLLASCFFIRSFVFDKHPYVLRSTLLL